MLAPWKISYDQPRQYIQKHRHYFANKGPSGQSYGFSSSHQSVSSVTQSCLSLCNPMNCSMPGFPGHHQLPELTQTHIYWVGDAIQPSCSLYVPSIFPSIRVFSNELALCITWPKYCGVSASASVLLMNIQDWFPLGWTGWISLQSKGLSSVFSNTTVQKHQFFSTQHSLGSNSHIHAWLLEKP